MQLYFNINSPSHYLQESRQLERAKKSATELYFATFIIIRYLSLRNMATFT